MAKINHPKAHITHEASLSSIDSNYYKGKWLEDLIREQKIVSIREWIDRV